MIFGQTTIKARVLKSIHAKLDAMDKEHDELCRAIDERAEQEKSDAADKMVESITKKFL